MNRIKLQGILLLWCGWCCAFPAFSLTYNISTAKSQQDAIFVGKVYNSLTDTRLPQRCYQRFNWVVQKQPTWSYQLKVVRQPAEAIDFMTRKDLGDGRIRRSFIDRFALDLVKQIRFGKPAVFLALQINREAEHHQMVDIPVFAEPWLSSLTATDIQEDFYQRCGDSVIDQVSIGHQILAIIKVKARNRDLGTLYQQVSQYQAQSLPLLELTEQLREQVCDDHGCLVFLYPFDSAEIIDHADLSQLAIEIHRMTHGTLSPPYLLHFQTQSFATLHPEQRFVDNHVNKPIIQSWKDFMNNHHQRLCRPANNSYIANLCVETQTAFIEMRQRCRQIHTDKDCFAPSDSMCFLRNRQSCLQLSLMQ
ncbi:MAG: hypothetical protein ISP86_02100 [Shewanellaceae bacterium]|nr:hypothetical protein [Shewanellaceae bacterium]